MKEPTEEVELRNIAGEPLTQEDRENLYTRFRKFGKALKDNVELEKIGETRATVSVGLDRIETVLRMAAANFPRIKEELVTPVTITDNLGRYVIKRSSNRIEVTLCQFLRREDDPHFEMAAGSMSIGKEGVSGEVIGNIYERKNSAGQDMREEHGLQFDYKDEGQSMEATAFDKRITVLSPTLLKVERRTVEQPFRAKLDQVGKATIIRGLLHESTDTQRYG